ncbi:low molecular weight protein-tyrosine-phosphatase [Thiohalorhabdus sp.]|uniref:low molecular weight protein-tyrosine-phosphatase n=1 Tax=Thiohalorhabdus sp. TaxID=3094134 RepID=UPI003FCD61D7
MRILVVCLGNICRSPMAQGILARKLDEAGLGDRVQVDSAGTGDYQVGKGPDVRARMSAGSRGYDLSRMRARQVEVVDFRLHDLILATDRGNQADLQALAPDAADRRKVRLFLEYASGNRDEVPDPYQGDWSDFALALDLLEAGAEGLVAAIQRGDWDRGASA